MTRFAVKAAFVCTLVAQTVLAHDLWLEPTEFVLPASGSVTLELFVGHPFKPEVEIANETKKITRLAIAGPNGIVQAPAFSTRLLPELMLDAPGTYTIAMERTPSTVVLTPRRFRNYLEEEGHTQLSGALEGMNRPARERFTRHLKSIIHTGASGGESYKRTFGTTLEIIPQRDPASLNAGEALPVQVLFEGAPLRNVRIALASRSGGDVRDHETSRTDENGRASFVLPRPADYMLRTTTIRPCAGCADVDYESFWSTLTFAID